MVVELRIDPDKLLMLNRSGVNVLCYLLKTGKKFVGVEDRADIMLYLKDMGVNGVSESAVKRGIVSLREAGILKDVKHGIYRVVYDGETGL